LGFIFVFSDGLVMIYRKNPRFIFIHIPKTGGTSIESALCRYLLGAELSEISPRQAKYCLLPGPGFIHQHCKIREFLGKYGPREVNEFFQFAFVRNPWDLVASEIFYFQKERHPIFHGLSFADSVRRLVSYRGQIWGHDFSPQKSYLVDANGRLSNVFIGRFERLQSDFSVICEKLGFPDLKLPHLLQTDHERPMYPELYDDTTRGLVAEHFQEDINEFGYSFLPGDSESLNRIAPEKRCKTE
jgi:hypothetical protein